MASETTILLRRAVALRHTPEAQIFWSTALDALMAGTADPEIACRVLQVAIREPMAADSVHDWLSALVLSCPEPMVRAPVLAHAGVVGAALADVRSDRGPTTSARGARMRGRVREAMAVATA